MRRKADSNVFFDQAGESSIGWYANSAVEAAVFGIPTLAHLSEDAFDGAVRGGHDVRERCPIVNAPLDVAGIRATVGRLVELSPRERRDLSLRTRAWVEEFHSFRVVGPQLVAAYDAAEAIAKKARLAA
jgi:hypothetical protein